MGSIRGSHGLEVTLQSICPGSFLHDANVKAHGILLRRAGDRKSHTFLSVVLCVKGTGAIDALISACILKNNIAPRENDLNFRPSLPSKF